MDGAGAPDLAGSAPEGEREEAATRIDPRAAGLGSPPPFPPPTSAPDGAAPRGQVVFPPSPSPSVIDSQRMQSGVTSTAPGTSSSEIPAGAIPALRRDLLIREK